MGRVLGRDVCPNVLVVGSAFWSRFLAPHGLRVACGLLSSRGHELVAFKVRLLYLTGEPLPSLCLSGGSDFHRNPNKYSCPPYAWHFWWRGGGALSSKGIVPR